MSYCPLCGTQNFAGDKYCANCETNLTGATGHLLRHNVLEGRYIIIEALGRGGMGAVYKALDQRLGRAPVAIKEMSSSAVRSGDLQASIESFKKEASILVNLRHHALPRVIDFFSAGEDRWYLVMDYIEGKTLREVLEKRGPIPESEVLDWAGQICEILDYLHSQNPPVIFRDLKPSNIMLTPEGKIKLIDFGIARNFSPGLTSDTSAYGSPGYSPPEQHGQRQTDARSDIYALGATLHHLLTGLDPGKSPFIFEPPSKLVNISPEFESAIMKALEFKPENRISSIKEVISLLYAGGKSHFNWSGPLTLTGSVPKLDQNMTNVTDPGHEENSEQQSSSAGWDETVELWQNETANVTPEGREDTPETAGDFNYSYLAETQEVKSREEFPGDGNPGGRSGWIKKMAAAAGLVLLLAAGAYGYSHQVENNKTANNSQNQTAAVHTQQTQFQPQTQQQAQPSQYQQLNDQQLQKQQEELQRQQEELQQRQQNLETQKQQELIRQQEELRRQQEELQKLQQNEVTTQQQQEEIQRQQERYMRQQEELQRQQEEYERQQEEIRRQQEEYERQQEELQRQQEEYERQQEEQRQQEEYERQLEEQRQQEEYVSITAYVNSVPYLQKQQQNQATGQIFLEGTFASGSVTFTFPSGISVSSTDGTVLEGNNAFLGLTGESIGSRTVKYVVEPEGTAPIKIEFNFEVNVSDNSPFGDVVVTIGGSSGFYSSVVVARVIE